MAPLLLLLLVLLVEGEAEVEAEVEDEDTLPMLTLFLARVLRMYDVTFELFGSLMRVRWLAI